MRISSNGRSNCATPAEGSAIDVMARKTPARTATLASPSSSAATFFLPADEDEGALN